MSPTGIPASWTKCCRWLGLAYLQSLRSWIHLHSYLHTQNHHKVVETEWKYLDENEQWQQMKNIMTETAQVTWRGACTSSHFRRKGYIKLESLQCAVLRLLGCSSVWIKLCQLEGIILPNKNHKCYDLAFTATFWASSGCWAQCLNGLLLLSKTKLYIVWAALRLSYCRSKSQLSSSKFSVQLCITGV